MRKIGLMGLMGLMIAGGARAEMFSEIRLTDGRVLSNVDVISYSESGFLAKWTGGRGSVAFATVAQPLRAQIEAKKPMAVSTDAASNPKEAPSVDLGTSDTEIEVTNLGTKPWKTMVIYVNDVPDGFKFACEAPAPGKSVRLALTRFVDNKGNRFDPAKHGLSKVWIGGDSRGFQIFRVR